MKILRIFIILAFLANPLSARDFLPEGHLENFPIENSAVLRCYVFQTTPGVEYTVEFSNDLSHWTPQEEIYGLGNEHVVTMREYTPPPPPPPGTPPASSQPPAIQASLLMRPASGTAGGTVVSWKSLDSGGPSVVRIDGEMVAAWSQIPIFWERYGAFCFSIWHPGSSLTPPEHCSLLGAKDAAMLAALEANLAAMNEQVTDSLARSRNALPPAPPDPDSKRFWRVHINPDIDTDQDGSPDWADFDIAARGTGVLTEGVVGNAFNSDTNGDGIPDGTPDSDDIALEDDTATFERTPVPRYALFPITDTETVPEDDPPIQMNDQGTVLFANGTWSAGQWTDLQGADPEFFRLACGINDLGEIVGAEVWTRGLDYVAYGKTSTLGNMLYWASPSANYGIG